MLRSHAWTATFSRHATQRNANQVTYEGGRSVGRCWQEPLRTAARRLRSNEEDQRRD